jgi:hypothetical protein
MRQLLVTASVVPSLAILVNLINESSSSSETSVLTRATWCNIPEGTILHSHRHESLKSYNIVFIVTIVGTLYHRYFCVAGVHKYVLDDRLFARPLYSDHLNNSRCMECHLPHYLSTSTTGEAAPIPLQSALQDPEIQVSVPLGSPHGRRPSAPGNVLSRKKMTQPSGRGKAGPHPRSRSQPNLFMRTLGDLKPRAPPPADSLALRYQKGVAKWSLH